MKINDYKKVTDRLELKKDCFMEAINMMEQNTNKKHYWSKKKVIPVLAAAVVACTTMTAVFADELISIFHKDGNLEISIAEVNDPESKTIPIIKAVPKKWDENVINELFIKDKTVTTTDEYESDTNPDAIRKVLCFNDDSILCWEDGDLSWDHITDDHYDYRYIISKIMNGIDAGEILFPETTLDGFDKQTALDQAEAILSKLGISTVSSEIIALDKEHLILEDDCRNENGERIYKHDEILPEWTEDQEAYFMIFRTGNEELPVSDKAFETVSDKALQINDICAEGSEIHLVISKSGIECLLARWVYEPVESIGNAEICTAQEAADAIIENFKDVNAYYPTSIEHCRLTYVPVPIKQGCEFELRPYWEFYSSEKITVDGKDNNPTQDTYYKTLFVDCQTREVIF